MGITGTKGKSSTTYYLKYIFDEYLASKKKPESGVISSIDTYDGVERFESHLTTPEPLDLQRHFANAAAAGVEYLTMEVSSQALKYDRMDRVDLSAAVFLNIGYDHISPIEHPDFEDYFASKLKIFAHAPPGGGELGHRPGGAGAGRGPGGGRPDHHLLGAGSGGRRHRLPCAQAGPGHPLPSAHPPASAGSSG